MRNLLLRFLAISILFMAIGTPIASYGQPNTTDDSLTIKIRQTVFPENFTKQQLRVYRLEKGRLQILIEDFNDPEAEVSIEQELTTESMELLRQTLDRGRVMSSYIDCRVYTPASDTRLKTEMMIRYQGQSKVCYSFDKGFSNALGDVLSALNQIIPSEEHRVEIPRDNLKIMD